jgi:hypothetical protein
LFVTNTESIELLAHVLESKINVLIATLEASDMRGVDANLPFALPYRHHAAAA